MNEYDTRLDNLKYFIYIIYQKRTANRYRLTHIDVISGLPGGCCNSAAITWQGGLNPGNPIKLLR